MNLLIMHVLGASIHERVVLAGSLQAPCRQPVGFPLRGATSPNTSGLVRNESESFWEQREADVGQLEVDFGPLFQDISFATLTMEKMLLSLGGKHIFASHSLHLGSNIEISSPPQGCTRATQSTFFPSRRSLVASCRLVSHLEPFKDHIFARDL